MDARHIIFSSVAITVCILITGCGDQPQVDSQEEQKPGFVLPADTPIEVYDIAADRVREVTEEAEETMEEILEEVYEETTLAAEKVEEEEIEPEEISLRTLRPETKNLRYGGLVNNSLLGPINFRGIQRHETGFTIVPDDTNEVAIVRYDLNGEYTRFKATVGMTNIGSSRFRILADTIEMYASDVMTYHTAPIDLDLDITGVHELEIEVDPRGLPEKHEFSVADPVLLK